MNEILRKRHYRLVFYTVVFLVIVVVLLVRSFVLPSFDSELDRTIPQTVATLMDGIAISLVITVVVGSFAFWLTPEIVKRAPIEVLEPKEIGPLLAKAATDSRTWTYSGGCGRYTRAKTLVAISEAARKEGVGREVRISIMNPGNEKLCKEYATYRRSLKSANKISPWTENTVREELIATVASVLRCKYKEPLLRIHLHLVEHFSAFRFDISDRYVVVTKEDKEAPGLRADQSTYFYDSYRDDVTLTERQSRSIEFDDDILDSPMITVDELRQLVTQNDLVSTDVLNDLDLEKIVGFVNSPNDPYA